MKPIKDIPLRPRRVPSICQWSAPCKNHGDWWIVSPDGKANQVLCTRHADTTVGMLLAIEEGWSTAPYYHDDPAMPDQVKPR